MYAPRSHAPLASSSFAPPLSAFSENRPNFALGFGLDIPEEEEPQEATDQPQVAKHAAADTNPVDSDDSEDEDFDDAELDGRDGSTTAPNSRYHSRHVSRLSGALSLRSVGGLTEDFNDEGDNVPLRSPIPVLDVDDLDKDAVGEWTGSEDLYLGSIEPSEDEVCLLTSTTHACLTLSGVSRASANGLILLTRKGLVVHVSIAACVVVRKRLKCQGEFPTSLIHHRTL